MKILIYNFFFFYPGQKDVFELLGLRHNGYINLEIFPVLSNLTSKEFKNIITILKKWTNIGLVKLLRKQ